MTIEQLVADSPGITTPELAERMGVSVTYARWLVHQTGTLEFYDGNHIRLKQPQGAA